MSTYFVMLRRKRVMFKNNPRMVQAFKTRTAAIDFTLKNKKIPLCLSPDTARALPKGTQFYTINKK